MKAFKRELKFESYAKEIDRKDLIEKNVDYYELIFKSFDRGGEKRVFNIYALLLTPYWYIYRKMLLQGCIIIAIQVLLAMVVSVIRQPLWIGLFLLSFTLYIRAGFYGIYDYYKHINKLKIQGDEVDVKYRHKFVSDKSGVDSYIAACWVGGTIFLYAVGILL
nr:DUF2628 domain-containing protein [uncultured Peptostreptococcus sp.]